MDDIGGFSGVVKLSNVSDFIAPNLDCIIPLETKRVKKAEPTVQIRTKEERKKPKIESIKISLADCLACNGCITSAETVLIEEQSLSKVWESVATFRLSIVTVSPQAVCSIAAKLAIPVEETARRISRFFISRGVRHVVDSSFGRQFCLSLLMEEMESVPSTSRPLLSSACPGFVCYAEKSQGELLVPRISKIRSPQAVTGALVKNYLALKYKIEPCQIFHATVMPCFDKKLEASREQFLVPGTKIRETDCVVSTGHLIGESGGSSGGYAYRVAMDYASKYNGTINTSQLNKNMELLEVLAGDEILLRVAKGFGGRMATTESKLETAFVHRLRSR
ncbi:unnamed protein product [Caenorhabditis bovis]|uniref:Iron hydrogenase large subunit C-terminal domain-containing protein n=1 Tax=Caenorhabditis bovis TaxID=2654633 RepID=A0A8S1EGF0_9PELO|nr:unnamed protein product [Caenorhabditis bovis]